jgi:hypothetical protein
MKFVDLVKNFFTHKDFLPPANEIPGTMFTPLHFVFSAIVLALIIGSAIMLSRRSEKTVRTVFIIIWSLVVVLEVVKILWETLCGNEVYFEVGGILPLYPCSIFMYAMPLAIFGNDVMRRAGCGYVCTLGLIGGTINFVYPATILGNYSCISFAGFHTFLYHGAIVFCALTMLLSGYHSYKGITKFRQLLFPLLPFLFVSIIANAVNFSKINSDYMFFKLKSFIFAPIGNALPTAVCVLIVYIAYIIIHISFYLPSYILLQKPF